MRRSYEQQSILRSKQETARRAFLARKMPGMGHLWLHQQLLGEANRRRALRHRISASVDKRRLAEQSTLRDHTGKHWKSMIALNDPTADGDALNRERLLALQVNCSGKKESYHGTGIS